MTNISTITTLNVPTYRVAEVKKTVATINNKAAKLGLANVVLNVSPTTTWKKLTDANGNTFSVEYSTITVIGEIPFIAGWTYVGSIDHTEVTVVMSMDSENPVPEMYRTRGPVCDHCHTNRRRNRTIILKSTAGEYMQVGSTCVNDFVHQNVTDVMGYISHVESFINEDYDNVESLSGMEYKFEVKELFSLAVKLISTFGFVKSGEIGSTKDDMIELLYGKNKENREYLESKINMSTIAADEMADSIINWISTNTNTSEFILNLKSIINISAVSLKYAGYIAGAVASYMREMAKERENKETINNEYIDVMVGDKINLTVNVLSILYFENAWGTTKMHLMSDKDNHRLVWNSTSKELPIGTNTIKGTVKGFKEYKGVKQTLLTRVSAI